jgi:hypothetical protein
MSRRDDPASAPVIGPGTERPRERARAVRLLLPPSRSERHAVAVLVSGFAVEGSTELVQFAQRGSLVQGPLEYYATLATTIFGFYLMFLGVREWYAFRPRGGGTTSIGPTPQPGRLRLALWLGGTTAAAALSIALGGAGAGAAPVWIAWPVAGLLVLAIGDFFFGLGAQARRIGSPLGNALGWLAFGWSLGVATVAGLALGDRVVRLLTELVSNWVSLIASFGPIVVDLSPLFVAYALISGAFWPALQRPRRRRAAPPPQAETLTAGRPPDAVRSV